MATKRLKRDLSSDLKLVVRGRKWPTTRCTNGEWVWMNQVSQGGKKLGGCTRKEVGATGPGTTATTHLNSGAIHSTCSYL